MNNYFIYVDGLGFQGESDKTYSCDYGGEGWHIHNHNEKSVLTFGENAKAIEGVINLKSYTERIFGEMRAGRIKPTQIIINCQAELEGPEDNRTCKDCLQVDTNNHE